MKMGDGSDPLSAYDANGNIKKMWQKGWKIGGSVVIDDLTYQYNTNSNKLRWVRDANNDINTKLGDFKEPTQNSSDNLNSNVADYGYDYNGNMNVDANKSVSSITYNHLNLPLTVTVTGKGTITYTYDAAGNKIKKVTTEGSLVTTTTYLSGFVYMRASTSGSTADTLQFFGHEEGRVRYTPPIGAASAHYDYDYMLKDHLGNVRMLLTEETKQDVYPAATLEGNLNTSTDAAFIEKGFYTIDPTYVVNKSTATGITDYQNNNGNPPYNNNPNSNTTANSAKLYQMNSGTNKIGLSMALKVMAGDTVNIYGKSYFYVSGSISGSSSAPPLIDLLTAFVGTVPMTGKGITGSYLNHISQLTTGLSNLLGTQGGQTSTVPKAYINWVFFDERFNYAGGGFDRVGSSGTVKSHNNTGIVVPKNGYVFIYCSNESPHNVYFDNLQVIHSRGPIMEETHYYPFGLTMSGISSRASSFGLDNKNEYNGKEKQEKEFADGGGLDWIDFGARLYDPQIGRWQVIDPLIEKMKSGTPFGFCINNPLSVVDPDGQIIWFALGGSKNFKEFRDFLGDVFGKKVNVTLSEETGALQLELKKGKKLSKDQQALFDQIDEMAKDQENEYNLNLAKDDEAVQIDDYFSKTIDVGDLTKLKGVSDGLLDVFHYFTEQKYKKKNKHENAEFKPNDPGPEYKEDHTLTREDEKNMLGRSVGNLRIKSGESGGNTFEIVRYDIVDATGKPIRSLQIGWMNGGAVMPGHTKSPAGTENSSDYKAKQDTWPQYIKK